MANEEQLKILKQGVETWNAWRTSKSRVRVDLSGAVLISADLSGAVFRNSNLRNAVLGNTNLIKADLRGASLNGANLINADVRNAILDKAIFRDANFSGSDLGGADLIGANFINATLSRATLSRATLSRANLSGANLSGANLSGANLSGANLSGANLSGVNLSGANLSGANLSGANLSGARTFLTQFSSLELNKAKGLGQMNHRGRSTIGLDTIRLSKGNLPIEFMRGCGLTDFEIATAQLQNPNLPRNEFINLTYKLDEIRNFGAIDFHSCFISYSSKNKATAERLYKDLQNSGIRCWYAPQKMKIGEKIRPVLSSAISMHEKLLLIISKESIESQWVEDEVEEALAKERDEKVSMLFPIRLDNSIMQTNKHWAKLVKNTRHIGDFTNWENGKEYKKAFERLKKDLISEDDSSNILRRL